MGSTQKYSLKWNDFTVNVASTFRDLHSRHDFVDVTLACSDGSTLEAHKVILSSVSSYFRDILKTNPCKHPIVILKDTNRDEAQAMLEFAYTGEVNVAQDLLPTLLHTARSYKIKGLDKVESPVDPPQQTLGNRLEAQTPGSEQWVESAPPTRSHTPSSVHSHTTGSAVTQGVDHFMTNNGGTSSSVIATNNDKVSPNGINFPNSNFLLNVAREREAQQNSSSPPSLPSSQPPTRETSPSPQHAAALNNARTPPPKRWKRSFDLTHHPGQHPLSNKEQPLPLITEKYSPQNGRDYEHHNGNSGTGPVPAKRYCEPSQSNGDMPTTAPSGTNGHAPINGRPPINGVASNGQGANLRSLPYPHSMPTSPTMFERGNEVRLAGLFRHHLAGDLSRAAAGTTAATLVNGSLNGRLDGAGGPPGEIHVNSKLLSNGSTQQQASSTTNSGENALDYTNRCYANQQPKMEPQSESDYIHGRSNGTERGNGVGESESDRYPVRSLGFRPESAPTVLDMSPEGSLSGPPSVRNMDLSDMAHRDDEVHGHFENGDDAEYLSKSYGLTPDAMGRYTCDECGKIFKHPGSLQHHRHIHRGTHRCPSCGKVFSRRWDMERHLNKSKYGCPANRFSTGSSGSSTGSSGGGAGPTSSMTVTVTGPNILPSITPSSIASTAAAHLEMLAHASSVASSNNGVSPLGANTQHNTTA
jgi:predicted RNA-binding Zn-ribbon protein involved in translation (DUF1610 family)